MQIADDCELITRKMMYAGVVEWFFIHWLTKLDAAVGSDWCMRVTTLMR